MGISGNYIKNFDGANLATCVNIHLDANYPYVFFDVVAVNNGKVKLKSHSGGVVFEKDILTEKSGQQYAIIEQKSFFEVAFGKKPTKFKILPFSVERY